MGDHYKCTLCGRSNVKLWRPYLCSQPLICAACAEKRQSPLKYPEFEAVEDKDGKSHWELTGRNFSFPKWKVDDKGQIPYHVMFGMQKPTQVRTDQLYIDLTSFDRKRFPSKKTNLVPAIPDGKGFWGYIKVPDSRHEWWENLPTR